VRRFVIGVDGSPYARRATELVAELAPPRGGQVTLVRVIEPVTLPSLGLLPALVRRPLDREAAALARTQTARAERALETAVKQLEAAGWKVRPVVRRGPPLAELLATVEGSDADVLVVGSRGSGGVERLLLGSVAEGALNSSRVPVLVAR
jgi:nucleotide-binding universal stress UspA family protein